MNKPTTHASVLLADDSAPIREVLAVKLRHYFSVESAVENGRQLLDAALAGRPDVVVSDVFMPVLSGLEAMTALKALGRTVPFVLVSSDPDIANECLARGAAAFVCKVDIECDLVPAVLAALDGRTYISASVRPPGH